MKLDNTKTFKKFMENLKACNLPYSEMPLIFLYNKRDLDQILPMNILNGDLNPENRPFFPTVAETGENILESLDAIINMAINNCKNRLSIFQRDKTQNFGAEKTTPSFLPKNSHEANSSQEEVFTMDDPQQPESFIQSDMSKVKNTATAQTPPLNEVDFPIHIKMPENRDEIKVNLNFKDRIITIS